MWITGALRRLSTTGGAGCSFLGRAIGCFSDRAGSYEQLSILFSAYPHRPIVNNPFRFRPRRRYRKNRKLFLEKSAGRPYALRSGNPNFRAAEFSRVMIRFSSGCEHLFRRFSSLYPQFSKRCCGSTIPSADPSPRPAFPRRRPP